MPLKYEGFAVFARLEMYNFSHKLSTVAYSHFLQNLSVDICVIDHAASHKTYLICVNLMGQLIAIGDSAYLFQLRPMACNECVD